MTKEEVVKEVSEIQECLGEAREALESATWLLEFLVGEVEYYKGAVKGSSPIADNIIARERGEGSFAAPQYGMGPSVEKELSIKDLLRAVRQMESEGSEEDKEELSGLISEGLEMEGYLEAMEQEGVEEVGELLTHMLVWDMVGLDVERLFKEGVNSLSKKSGLEFRI